MNSVLSCQGSLSNAASGESRSNFKHDSGRQDRFFVLLASLIAISAFGGTVFIVVALSSQEEMRRIDARGIIPAWTVMQQAQAIRNNATSNRPRRVRSQCFSFSGPNYSIAETVKSTRPNPAIFGFIDFFPESHCQWPTRLACRARQAATFAPSAIYLIAAREKFLFAMFADLKNSLRIDSRHNGLHLGRFV